MIPSFTFGSGNLYINNEKYKTTVHEVDPVIDGLLDTGKRINYRLTEAIEFELKTTLDVPVLNMLTGPGTPARGFTLAYEGTYKEQIRKHKKKRINKKWAKRYGYREVPCLYKMENAKLLDDGLGGFEFRADSFTRLTMG